MSKNYSETDAEVSGKLSAIWILASKDENPIITYRSIRHRLGLSDSYNLEGLIKKHLELFRLKAPVFRLEEWKQQLREGKRRPTWLNEIESEEKRIEVINALTVNDVFRSQFRTKSTSEPSSIEVINWGLEHIERLRKVSAEEKETRWKWIKEGLIPISSIFVALLAIIASAWIQYVNIDSQEELKKYELDAQERLKKYEVSFSQRNDNYALIMQSFESAFKSAERKDITKLQTNLEQLESSYHKIRPFLSRETHSTFSNIFTDYSKYLVELNEKELSNDSSYKQSEQYKTFKNYFEIILYRELFENTNYVNTPVLHPVK
jgi:hypothetical protein